MTVNDEQLSEKESLNLIASMINKAKDSYRDTGIGAILWGTVIAVCSLLKLSEIQFGYTLPFDIYWLTLLAVIPQIFITIREKRQRRMKSYDDAYMDYIWLGFGICILLMSFIVNSVFSEWQPVSGEYRGLTGHSSPFLFSEFVSPLFLLLYGLPTFITGAACRVKPMLWGGLFCWVCCVATVFTEIRVDLLLTAVAAVFAWLIPGIIMKKEYREAKLQEASQHV